MIAICMTALLALGGDEPAARAAEEAAVEWKGRSYRCEELPEELGAAPRAAGAAWAEWAALRRYRMDLDADGRVLLLTPQRAGGLTRTKELVGKTSKLFDELLPVPKERAVPKTPGPTKREEPADDPDALPEDPDGGPVGWAPDDEPAVEPWETKWGAGTWPLDEETVVMLVLRDERDFGEALDELAAENDYLAEWAKTARRYTGFVLEKPLVGAYVLNATGQEEWHPDHELVNRLAQLLLVRRFSQQPYWITQGFGWYVEGRLLRAHYCFPYRAEFVYAVEHTRWGEDLKKRFQSRKDTPLSVEEFGGWRRGGFQGDVAQTSWGLVSWMVREHGEALPSLLERLRLFRDEDDRVDLGGGNWERRPGYEIPLADQERLLAAALGDDFLRAAADAFRKGIPLGR